MLPIEIAQIKRRTEALNLTLKKLARRQGVDASAVYRAARGLSDPRLSTLRSLSDGLLAEEQRLRAHLNTLHPEPRPAEPKS